MIAYMMIQIQNSIKQVEENTCENAQFDIQTCNIEMGLGSGRLQSNVGRSNQDTWISRRASSLVIL